MILFIDAIAISLAQIPGVILRYLPFHNELDKNKRKVLINSYLIFFIIEIAMIFIFINKFNMDILTFKKIIILGAYVYVVINCIVIKSRFFQHMFVLGMQAIYSLFLHSIVAFIQSNFYLSNSVNHQFFLQSILYIFLFIITLYPLVKLLKNTFVIYINENMSYYWNILWIIPFCLFYSDVILTMNNQWINTSNQLIARMLTLIASIIVFKCTTMDFVEKKNQLDIIHNNQLLKLQVSDLNDYFQAIENNKESLSILKHDMRHRLYLMKTLIDKGNYDEATHIIDNWNNNLDETNIISFCQNPIINASLSAYIKKTKKENIKVETDIDIPSNLNIDYTDLAVVILNLMENALNASLKQIPKEDKLIQINSRYSDGTLAIRLRNRFDGQVEFGEDGLPVSKSEGHGIGMRSIKAFSDKYKSSVSCSLDGGWFSVILFINE